MRIFSKLYRWTRKWSERPDAWVYLAILSFCESIFFPIPPDVILAPMILAKPEKVWRYAFITMLASIVGGVVGYALGYFAFEALVHPLFIHLNLMETYHTVQHWFDQYGFWVMLFAGFMPIPYKIFVISAGVAQMPFLPFIIASILGRIIRFYGMSAAIRFGGVKLEPLFVKYLDLIAWVAILAIGCFFLFGCAAPHQYDADDDSAILAPLQTLEQKRPEFHVVEHGDTLYLIGALYDLDYKEVAKLNHISEPYLLQPGQKVRLVGLPTKLMPEPKKKVAAVPPKQVVAKKKGVPAVQAEQTPKIQEAPKLSAGTWVWPTDGEILDVFQSNSLLRKGIDLGGEAGDSIYAARDGRVVYCGSGLRGFGEIIIIKHDQIYLSVYAHNQKLLVKEGAQVKAGQKIAEKGSSGTDRVKLHFEVRKHGTPIDPMQLLQKRDRS